MKIEKIDDQSVHISLEDVKKKDVIRIHHGMCLKDVLGVIVDQKSKKEKGLPLDSEYNPSETRNEGMMAFMEKAKDVEDIEKHIRDYFHEKSTAYGVPFESNAI